MEPTSIFQSITNWAIIAGVVIFAAAQAYGQLSKGTRAARQERDSVESAAEKAKTELITVQKEQIAQFERKDLERTLEIKDMLARINTLEGANKTLADTLLGRDKDGAEFQKQALESIRISHIIHSNSNETLVLTKQMADQNITINKNIERLFEVLMKRQ